MSTVRSLEQADTESVARMFMRIYRHSDDAPPASLVDYLQLHYLDAPVCDPEIPSLVHVDDDGTVSGFIGVNTFGMFQGDRPLRAAVCGTLMVEAPETRPMAGARLMKLLLGGAQDVTLSETASDKTSQMWKRLRGEILPLHSLDWFRIIRPAAFAIDTASHKLSPARWLKPVARSIDTLLRKRARQADLRWSAVDEAAFPPTGMHVEETDRETFAGLFERFTAHHEIRPDCSGALFPHLLGEGLDKPDYGNPVLAQVTARTGTPVGAVLYHYRPGSVANVLQLLARPGQEGAVIDALIVDAAKRGASALRGRLQPALLEPMLVRRIALVPIASSVVHSPNADLLRAFTESRGFFNGLIGEHWSRFYGGTL